ncbi:MAG: hypothetical protein EZS28_056503, partial [Streblomastix strix]
MNRERIGVDQIIIGAGNALIIITNGQIEHQHYPFKCFNELAITNGSNWYLPNIPLYTSPQQNEQSTLNIDIESPRQDSLHSDKPNINNNLSKTKLKIGSSELFIISAQNSSMVVDMSSGAFYDFP